MVIFNVVMIFGMMLATFGLALPWLISNSDLPLFLDIMIFMALLWVYGLLAQHYIKALLVFIKKEQRKEKNEKRS